MMEEQVITAKGFNVNTIVSIVATFIILATMTWVGRTSSDNNEKLTKLDASLPYLQSSIIDLKTQMASFVTRPELEAKVLEVKLEQSKLQIQILQLSKDENAKAGHDSNGR